MSEVFATSSHPYFITCNLIYMFFCDVSLTELGIGLTVAGQNDYCDTITIAESTIAILLLLPKALLRYYYYCRKHYCDTITIAESTIAILLLLQVRLQYYCYNYSEYYLQKTKDFHKALVLMTSSVEILFESLTIAVTLDELST